MGTSEMYPFGHMVGTGVSQAGMALDEAHPPEPMVLPFLSLQVAAGGDPCSGSIPPVIDQRVGQAVGFEHDYVERARQGLQSWKRATSQYRYRL